MTIGLGTGSTVFYVIERIEALMKSGKIKNLICVPTSIDTEMKVNIKKNNLEDFSFIIKRGYSYILLYLHCTDMCMYIYLQPFYVCSYLGKKLRNPFGGFNKKFKN